MTKVSLVIPIYNEAQHLQKFLEVVDQLDLKVEKELIIVDDASKDNSREIVQAFRFKSPYQFHVHKENRGKGAALQLGFEKATGTIIGVQDADFEYDIRDIERILQPILEGRADVVYGSRFKKTNIQVHRTFHYLVNRFLTLESNLLSGLYLTDMETCYKFFDARIIKNIQLECQRFGFEPEITAKLARLDVRIAEIPISYYPRSYIQGKKITWKDGIAAMWHILRFNMIANSNACFRSGMPKEFMIAGRKWL